jgi:hypothetical protein
MWRFSCQACGDVSGSALIGTDGTPKKVDEELTLIAGAAIPDQIMLSRLQAPTTEMRCRSTPKPLLEASKRATKAS